MPVLEVTALPQREGQDLMAVRAALCVAVADVLGEKPTGTWVVWRTVEASSYAEHRDAPDSQPDSTHPPIVRVTAYEGRSQAVIAAVLTAVADTLVRELGLAPGNVLVRWDEVSAGRLNTGGRVVGA